MFKFKKIASLLASTVMVSSTIALAAAANYPTPFVQGGSADVALVWGANAANTDLAAVVDITSNLNSFVVSTSTTTTTTDIVGEAAPLFSGGTKLYINDSINTVKSVLTKTELPTVLKDESFSGIDDATITQTIDLGVHPKLLFSKQPTSSDDPQIGYTLSTSSGNYLYNATATFSKVIDFTNSSSEGEPITLFGQTFTVSSVTGSTDLVLLKEAEKVALTSDDPSAEVTIAGETYTIELVSASDSAATIKVTNSAGVSQSREINQDTSKKVNGITIAITTADETNLQLSATVIAGAEKVTLSNGNNVQIGEDATAIQGTKVKFTGGASSPQGLSKIIVSVAAPDSSNDALLAGETFVDPVFGSFKFDFSDVNIPAESTKREMITFTDNGDDKLDVKFMDWRGEEKTITYISNRTAMALKRDDDGRNITVYERQVIKPSEYVVVGNEDEGYLLELTSVYNSSSSGTTGDLATFTDVLSGDTYKTTWSSEGTGTLTVGGRVFTVHRDGGSDLGSGDQLYNVTLDYPDSAGEVTTVLFPSIQTSKGAKIAFYQPTVINLRGWDNDYQGATAGNFYANNLTTISIPDGDGYSSITIAKNSLANVGGEYNITVGAGTLVKMNLSNFSNYIGGPSASGAIGQFTWNVTGGTDGDGLNATIRVTLVSPGGNNIIDPGLIIWEEKDDNNLYEGMVITTEAGNTADDGIGVSDVVRTWENDGTSWEHSRASDSKKQDDIDLWGALITTDTSDSDQATSTISYPDEQVYAMVYVGEEAAAITSGGGSTGGSTNIVSVSDSEVASVAGKNIVVVGGSCVNSVAASLLGSTSPICGSDFTTETTVGAGQFLIETFSRTGGKIATLVAGYNAGDTTNAAKYLTTQEVMTDVGTKYLGTSSTSAELVTETATETTA